MFFSNFIKENKIMIFKGEAHFGHVVFKPLKITGFEEEIGHTKLRLRAKDCFAFALMNFKNIIGAWWRGL